MPKTALVTGSDGFIGRHISVALENRGYRVLGIDIAHGNDAVKFFQRSADRYDLIVHCAYTVGGRATIDGRNTALISNEILDASLFDWALKTRQRAVLYFSSSAAYPVYLQNQKLAAKCLSCEKPRCPGDCPFKHILSEDDIDLDEIEQPDANYGWAKINGERLARVASENGLRVHVVRPFSGYAEDQSLDYPFPSIIRRAVVGDLTVWGPPGQTRDWIHVDDVINGALAIYENDERRPVNLCTGRGVEMGDLMFMAQFAHDPSLRDGISFPVTYQPDKPTGVHFRVGNSSRMNEHYTAEISLEEGIRRALAAG